MMGAGFELLRSFGQSKIMNRLILENEKRGECTSSHKRVTSVKRGLSVLGGILKCVSSEYPLMVVIRTRTTSEADMLKMTLE